MQWHACMAFETYVEMIGDDPLTKAINIEAARSKQEGVVVHSSFFPTCVANTQTDKVVS